MKDRKILSTIEVNGRLSYAEIGKKVGLSKQVVKYRMDLLEKKNIIQEYYAIINDSKLEREVYYVYLKIADFTDEDELKLKKNLKRNRNVLSFFSTLGKWDLAIGLFADNNAELENILHRILKDIKNKVQEKAITSLIEWEYMSTKILSDIGKNRVVNRYEKKEGIDSIDQEIIDRILENGRESFVELAENLGMSANGIKERIRRLEKKNIINGYKTKINYEKLGFLTAHLFITTNNFDSRFYSSFKEFLAEEGNTEAVFRFFGYADIELRYNTQSIGELYRFKKRLKNEFKDNILDIDAMFIVRSNLSNV